MEISEGLLEIFEASPRLESLSLLRLRPRIPVVGDHLQYTPSRIVEFASLTSLYLDKIPKLVGYILARMSVPVIDSLVDSCGVLLPLGSGAIYFPDDHLRILEGLAIVDSQGWPGCGYGIYDSLSVKIGSTYIQFNFDMDESGETLDAIMASVLPLVPPSVTSLRLDYSNLDRDEWTEFFQSRRSAFHQVFVFEAGSHVRVVVARLVTRRSGCGDVVSKTRFDLTLQRVGVHASTQLPSESENCGVRAQAPQVV